MTSLQALHSGEGQWALRALVLQEGYLPLKRNRGAWYYVILNSLNSTLDVGSPGPMVLQNKRLPGLRICSGGREVSELVTFGVHPSQVFQDRSGP